MKPRIDFLDGLRGIAILMVLIFHGYARWPRIFPFGSDYKGIMLVQESWLGVYLFFMISGFVILMSLERSESIKQFAWRRWLRLFPAMLIASILIYATASFFHERPRGSMNFLDLLPGLTFIDYRWLNKVIDPPVMGIEYAFWSLYVEAKFYLFATIVYFFKGKMALIGALVFAFLFTLFLHLVPESSAPSWFAQLKSIVDLLSLRYFGWFAVGAMFYCFYSSRNGYWFIGASLLGILCSVYVLDMRFKLEPALMGLFVTALFACSFISKRLQSLLSSKWILFFGFISYPLYLIHENAMTSLTVKTHAIMDIPMVFTPIPGILLLTLVAYLITRYAEPTVKKVLSRLSHG